MSEKHSTDWLDKQDPLKNFRQEFHLPVPEGKPVTYLCGNSLGLQPKNVQEAVQQELDDWARYGVAGHVQANTPWMEYHKHIQSLLAPVVGAKEEEVVAMNGLSANLHLLMVSFYQPTSKRHKILIEKGAFSSMQYVVETQLRHHGFDPSEAMIVVGEDHENPVIEEEEIEAAIQSNKDELALVLLGGAHYATGQIFDMERITKAAHEAGAYAGYDLAHAAGNVPLGLHDWEVDFAAWCSYKYLNSGPGGVAGIFVHENHARDTSLHRFGGWWGHREDERFLMKGGFEPMPGAAGWQLSNAPVLAMAAHKASLEIFNRAGMQQLREKSIRLTNFLDECLEQINEEKGKTLFERITPSENSRRGCQLTCRYHGDAETLVKELKEHGVVADWRTPDRLRITPVPLYNNFRDIEILQETLNKLVD